MYEWISKNFDKINIYYNNLIILSVNGLDMSKYVGKTYRMYPPKPYQCIEKTDKTFWLDKQVTKQNTIEIKIKIKSYYKFSIIF